MESGGGMVGCHSPALQYGENEAHQNLILIEFKNSVPLLLSFPFSLVFSEGAFSFSVALC